MKPIDALDSRIALVRVVLSAVAIASVYVDPTVPNLTPWFALSGGFFAIDRYALAILCIHFSYSATLYLLTRQGLSSPASGSVSKTLDVAFGVVIAVFTEGSTSPAYVFFTFAILAVACREGFRATAVVTIWCVALYLLLVSVGGMSWNYVMRPFYLAITGSLIGFLGQQRVDFETRASELEAIAERHVIARSLHDGYVQALAGVILRLESSRELVRRKQWSRVLEELSDLQAGVAREYDGVRRYIRSLVTDAEPCSPSVPVGGLPVSLRVEVCASSTAVEELLQILLEGARNVARHSSATSASLSAHAVDGRIRVTIDDDGVGFAEGATTPWTIASRVNELGGDARVLQGRAEGAHLEIDLPTGDRA